MNKESNVVLNFKMSGQVEYAKTIRDINAIMNAAASEYKTHVAAMGKDADQTKKLAAEKKKLETQLEAGRKRTQQLRTEYESMAKSTHTTTGQLANKYRQLQNSERAEIALERALERVNEGLTEQAIEAREAEEALNKLEVEADALETQTEKLNAEYKLQVAQLGANAKETEKLKLKTEQLKKEHDLAKEKVKNYEQQLEQAKKQYGENSREVDKYEIELIEARKAEQELANEIVKTNKQLKEQESVLKNTSTKLGKVGDKMIEVGKDLTKKVTLPIVGVGAASAKSAIDFESAFADVRKTVDATEEDFAELSEGIRNMSKELPTAASEIAGVTATAGQLGIANEHLLTFTRTMIDLGVATDMSGEDAATTLARLANITQMSQADFDRLGSTIVDLGNNFAATEGEIAEMGMRIAGAGSQIGMSEADILGFSAALASVGIKAEAGGSAVSKLMIEMASDVEQGGERLEEFARVAGMSVEDFQKAFEEDAATAIFTFLGGLGELSEEGESAFAIIDELGLSEIRLRDTILRTSNARDMANEALKTANNAWKENVALEDEAAERYKTTASQLSILKNEIVDVAIDLGEILIPVIKQVVEAIRPWIERFKEMDESTRNLIVIIGAIAAAIGPVLMVIGSIAKGIGIVVGVVGKIIAFGAKLMPLFKAIGAVIAGLSAPVWAVVAAVAALIAIGVAVWKNWEPIKKFFINFWDKIKKVWSGFVDWIKGVFNSVVDFLKEWGLVLLGAVLGPVTLAASLIFKYWDPIKRFFTETIPQAFNKFVDYAKELPGKVMEFLKKLFVEDIPYAIGYGIGWMVNKISEGFTAMVEFFKELPGRIWEFITETIENVTTWAADMKDKAIETGTEFLRNIIDYLKKLPGRVWNFLTETIAKITQWISNTKDKAIEAGSTFLNNVIDFIKKLPGRVWTFLTETITKMADFAKNMKDKALETGKNIYNSIVDEVKKIPGRLYDLGSDIINGLVNGVKNVAGKVWGLAKDIASNLTNGFKNALGIKSPSRVMMEIGRYVTEGLGIGIEDMAKYAVGKSVNVAKGISNAMKDGIELPDMEIGTVVRQPRLTTPSQMSAISNIGNNIKESLQDLSGNIAVHVYLDADQVNTKLAPGMSKKLNSSNIMKARSQGVIIT